MKLDLKPYEEKMKKSILVLEDEFGGIRVGKASAKLLDKIKVDYYGSPTGMDGVATVKSPDPRTLVITPWESNMLKPIEKAIQASDLGITPQNDGKCIRLNFPSLNEERRKELVKQVTKMGEEAKVALRNIRRDANDTCKTMKKNSEMTEDEQKASEKSVQDLTDKYIKMIDELTSKKEKEIMKI